MCKIIQIRLSTDYCSSLPLIKIISVIYVVLMIYHLLFAHNRNIVSILTDAHCVCNFPEDAKAEVTTKCKPHKKDPSKKNPSRKDPNYWPIRNSNDIPVNQHTGPHWSISGTKENAADNSIVINFYPDQAKRREIEGTSLESELRQYAIDAYIMSVAVEDGNVFRTFNHF